VEVEPAYPAEGGLLVRGRRDGPAKLGGALSRRIAQKLLVVSGGAEAAGEHGLVLCELDLPVVVTVQSTFEVQLAPSATKHPLRPLEGPPGDLLDLLGGGVAEKFEAQRAIRLLNVDSVGGERVAESMASSGKPCSRAR